MNVIFMNPRIDDEIIDLSISIGKLIRQLRENCKQEIAAEEIGISTRSLSEIENGNTMIKLNTLILICRYYKISIKDFFSEVENIKNTIYEIEIKKAI